MMTTEKEMIHLLLNRLVTEVKAEQELTNAMLTSHLAEAQIRVSRLEGEIKLSNDTRAARDKTIREMEVVIQKLYKLLFPWSEFRAGSQSKKVRIDTAELSEALKLASEYIIPF